MDAFLRHCHEKATEEHHLCLQATTNVNNPPTPPPIETNASSSEEHHLCYHPPKNSIFVCKQPTTNVNNPPSQVAWQAQGRCISRKPKTTTVRDALEASIPKTSYRRWAFRKQSFQMLRTPLCTLQANKCFIPVAFNFFWGTLLDLVGSGIQAVTPRWSPSSHGPPCQRFSSREVCASQHP